MFPSRQQARTWARGLGWFSLALGAIELLAGRRLARGAGRPGDGALLRSSGVREIVNGVALLNTREPGLWMWARVAGDATDLAALASGARRPDGRFDSGTAIALGAVVGVAALDLMVARSLTSSRAAAHADYSRRSGLPLPPDEMRGAARMDFHPPADMLTPPELRPWPLSG
jgi:hypothetical protein